MRELSSRKHPEFLVRQETPMNGGSPISFLRQSFVTPTEWFFVRSHGNIPEVDISTFRLNIIGIGISTQSLSLEDIRANHLRVTIPATIQCAGNRRRELMTVKPIPGEIEWGAEAIGHAHWTGVRLRDVLRAAGIKEEINDQRYVEFSGLDIVEKENKKFHYACSIPLVKALSPEVILVSEMNGEPLDHFHGYPFRVVVPGYIGARSVKWLNRITVLTEPSHNYFQRKSYRLFPPDVHEKNVDWEKGMMLSEMNLSSVVCNPQEGDNLPKGRVCVQGYAITGGDQQVARVDLSTDGGNSWVQAELLEKNTKWTWYFWQAFVDLEPGNYQLVVRAVDTAANFQPCDVHEVWNFKGYMNNAWNRVNIMVSG